MSSDLQAPIGGYFKARNDFDLNAILAPFDQTAVVKDEDEEHRGRAATINGTEFGRDDTDSLDRHFSKPTTSTMA
jgi:hypothetical protein